jgi:hypothetical protein
LIQLLFESSILLVVGARQKFDESLSTCPRAKTSSTMLFSILNTHGAARAGEQGFCQHFEGSFLGRQNEADFSLFFLCSGCSLHFAALLCRDE